MNEIIELSLDFQIWRNELEKIGNTIYDIFTIYEWYQNGYSPEFTYVYCIQLPF